MENRQLLLWRQNEERTRTAKIIKTETGRFYYEVLDEKRNCVVHGDSKSLADAETIVLFYITQKPRSEPFSGTIGYL